LDASAFNKLLESNLKLLGLQINYCVHQR